MELVRRWGLEDAVRAGADDVGWRLWTCETLAEAGSGAGAPVGVPDPGQCAVLSPTTPACVPQDHLESVLEDHLRGLPSAGVVSGAEVVAFRDGPGGAVATLRDTQRGTVRRVRARYVVAADGAHSTVRAACDIPMRGSDHLLEAVTAVFRAPLWDVAGPHRYGIYWITHPEATGNLLPAGHGDRWVYGLRVDPGSEGGADSAPERFAHLIRLACGVPNLEPRIDRISSFSFAAMIADTFRAGRTFLVGDAAHRITPRGGTGMNTAIADGFDLGWKLAWVLSGWAHPGLLDSYETDRRPIVEHNLARSADPSGSIREPIEELHADLGGRIAHAWSDAARRVSTLDLVGPGLTLFTATASTAWRDAAASVGGPVPIRATRLEPFAARAIGVRGRGAVLVRADGAPVGCWISEADAHGVLRTAVEAATGGGARGLAEARIA
jgi:2-polyprenyl-6-methoxyphenol hydroxylase-like FAD-dependent oxidoreductase